MSSDLSPRRLGGRYQGNALIQTGLVLIDAVSGSNRGAILVPRANCTVVVGGSPRSERYRIRPRYTPFVAPCACDEAVGTVEIQSDSYNHLPREHRVLL